MTGRKQAPAPAATPRATSPFHVKLMNTPCTYYNT